MSLRIMEITLSKRRAMIYEKENVQGCPTGRQLHPDKLICHNQRCERVIIREGEWVVSKPAAKNFARFYHKECAVKLNII